MSDAETMAGGVLAQAPHRVAGVSLVVHDLDRVGAFYGEVIGLAVRGRDGDRMELGTGDRTLVALRRDPAARRASNREAGLFHTAFLLPGRPDLSAWLRHASARGVPFQGASDHGVSEAIYLADPEGNGIEVYADRPASAWKREGTGVVMTTERLDLAALAAASDRPFAGFPAGGCVGHVHLQVGEIDPAEAFYRDVLGFDVTCRYPGGSFYGSGGYHHQLASNVWNSRGAEPRTEPATGLAEVGLLVSRSVLEAVRARTASHSAEEGPSLLRLRDPWGTSFALTA